MVIVTLSEAEREALQQLTRRDPLTPAARRAQALLWTDAGQNV